MLRRLGDFARTWRLSIPIVPNAEWRQGFQGLGSADWLVPAQFGPRIRKAAQTQTSHPPDPRPEAIGVTRPRVVSRQFHIINCTPVNSSTSNDVVRPAW